MSLGLLISSFDFSPVAEDEFHDWYDTEHLPERARIPGFLDLKRWLDVDHPKVSLTTYELASPEVLRSPGYLAVGYENNSPWTRRVGWRCIKRLRAEAVQLLPGDLLPPKQAGALVVIAVNAAEGAQAPVEAWIATRLRAALLLPEVLCARAFCASAGTHRYVLTYHLASIETSDDAQWQSVALDPWTQRSQQVSPQDIPQISDLLITRCIRYQRR